MDPFVRHALDTGLVSLPELAAAAYVPEAKLYEAVYNKAKLDKISQGQVLIICTQKYWEKNPPVAVTPLQGESHGTRHTDARGCLHIPKQFCKEVSTENFKLYTVVDANGNKILLISAAHLPDPSLNGIPKESVPVVPMMPEPIHEGN